MKSKWVFSLFAVLSMISLTSCASALKKKCESTNWFEYGESVAKKGARPASDSFVLDCKKEEARVDSSALSKGFQKGMDEYCTTDFAYRLGKQGEFLSADFCGGGIEIQMKPKHREGVAEYCQATNGENAGTTGKKYNQICPKELETAFLPEFNKGRKKYLQGVIVKKEGEIKDLENQETHLEREKQEVDRNVRQLRWERTQLQPKAPLKPEPDNPIQKRIGDIDHEVNQADWKTREFNSKINGLRERENALRQQLREAEGELPTL